MNKIWIFLPALLVFACHQQNKQNEATGQANGSIAMDAALHGLFEPQIVVKMHFFSARDSAGVPADYPYAGIKIDGQLLNLLDGSLSEGEGSSELHACYFIENAGNYVLRSGRDLLLARWNAGTGRLEKTLVLASYDCQNASCRQQDAWLIDLDDDRSLELIIRSQAKDAGGNILADDFKVLSEKDDSYSDSSPELIALAIKDRYLLH
ncbi:MAG: hypothetical protein RI973_1126 [Bacteroidota bacterium]|jgi:hypothetical protein